MKKNNHLVLIILVLIVMVSLMYINISLKYDKSKEVINKSYIVHNSLVEANNTIDTDTNPEEEISLGDTSLPHCKTIDVSCPGSLVNKNDGYCYQSEPYKSCHSGVPKSSCRGSWKSGGGAYNLGTCCTTEYNYRPVTAATKTCTQCEDGYGKSNGGCVECKLVGAASTTRDKVSPGQPWCINIKASSSDCKVIYSHPNGCVTPTKECQSVTVTATLNGTKASGTVYALKEWEEVEGSVFTTKVLNSDNKDDADAWIGSNRAGEKAEMEYGELKSTTIEPDGEVVYEYTNYHKRGDCGTSRVKTYSFCCVDNEYIGVSDNVKWADHKLKNNTSTFNACEYYYGKGYTPVNATQAQCHKPTPVAERCQYSSTGLKKAEENTNSCEEAKEISISEGEKCSDSDPSKSFYTIKCDRTAKTNFDYGDDNDTSTVREIYKGQGFKFGITVESSIECRGEFSGSKWINVYNLLKGKLDAVDPNLINYCNNYDYKGWDNYINNVLKPKKESAKSELYKLWRIIEELKEIVDNYNKYEPNVEYNEEATLDFTYKVGGKVVRLSTQSPNQSIFERSIVSEGKYVSSYENVVNLGVKGVTNPKNYLRSSKSNPRIVKLTPKNVYINTNTTNIQTDAKNAISGGNKIYIDYATDTPQTITPINITVTGLAGNNSTINNNQCTLKVRDMEIIYRPIDVSNPFINNTWTPGKNWVNSQFDFRNIIHSNIWSTSSYYAKYTNSTWNKSK